MTLKTLHVSVTRIRGQEYISVDILLITTVDIAIEPSGRVSNESLGCNPSFHRQ